MTRPFVSESLQPAHQVSSFTCGKPELDLWLKHSALHAQSNRTARTFVWHRADGIVRAYFSLAASVARREELPKRVGRGSPQVIPAVLLARLALETSLHGQRLGPALLVDALQRVVAATESIAARMLIVDAIDEEAATFYERHGFTRAGPLRLCQKISDVAAAVKAETAG